MDTSPIRILVWAGSARCAYDILTEGASLLWWRVARRKQRKAGVTCMQRHVRSVRQSSYGILLPDYRWRWYASS
jgi:hypothetical protein